MGIVCRLGGFCAQGTAGNLSPVEVEHHLWPAMSFIHLREVSQVLKSACKEFPGKLGTGRTVMNSSCQQVRKGRKSYECAGYVQYILCTCMFVCIYIYIIYKIINIYIIFIKNICMFLDKRRGLVWCGFFEWVCILENPRKIRSKSFLSISLICLALVSFLFFAEVQCMTSVVRTWILEQQPPAAKRETGKKLACLHIRAAECRVGQRTM